MNKEQELNKKINVCATVIFKAVSVAGKRNGYNKFTAWSVWRLFSFSWSCFLLIWYSKLDVGAVTYYSCALLPCTVAEDDLATEDLKTEWVFKDRFDFLAHDKLISAKGFWRPSKKKHKHKMIYIYIWNFWSTIYFKR